MLPKQHVVLFMSRLKNPRNMKMLVAVIIIGVAASLIIVAYNWGSIFPSKYPIALGNIIFSTDTQVESVSIGVKMGETNGPVIADLVTLNTTGLEPLVSPQSIPEGGKYATSDYITPTKYYAGQTVVIDRVSNSSQIHEQLTITISSKMLQYTAGYYVNLTSTGKDYAFTIPLNATWSSLL